MRIILFITTLFVGLAFGSCNSEPTLQKYFAENTENKDFIALDVSSSILNTDKTKLTAEQKTALQSFDKMNIIAFKATDKNQKEYETEKSKLNTILHNEQYQQLMKFGSGKRRSFCKLCWNR